MYWKAAPVEHGCFDPTEVGGKPRAKHDRADACRMQLERPRFILGLPRRSVFGLDRSGDALLFDIRVDRAIDTSIYGVGSVQVLLQLGLEGGDTVYHGGERAVQLHAFEGHLSQIDVTPAIAAGHVVVRLVSHLLAIRVLLDWDVVVAQLVQPFHDVSATVATRATRRWADRQMHLTSGQVQIFGDLRARLTGPNHEDGPFRQRFRVSV